MTTVKHAIKWFKDDIDVREVFPIENDLKLEVFKIAVEALEKQIPRKPFFWEDKYYYSPTPNDDWGYECPCCGNRDIDYPEHHCTCGQALDWSEIE